MTSLGLYELCCELCPGEHPDLNPPKPFLLLFTTHSLAVSNRLFILHSALCTLHFRELNSNR